MSEMFCREQDGENKQNDKNQCLKVLSMYSDLRQVLRKANDTTGWKQR